MNLMTYLPLLPAAAVPLDAVAVCASFSPMNRLVEGLGITREEPRCSVVRA
jgi:hypothetical protein